MAVARGGVIQPYALFLCCVFVVIGSVQGCEQELAGDSRVFLYPGRVIVSSGQQSPQPISVLSVKDQQGAEDRWDAYIEFMSMSNPYNGRFVFRPPAGNSLQGPVSVTLFANFRGQALIFQEWIFELLVGSTPVKIGDNSDATTGWTTWTPMYFSLSGIDMSQLVNADGDIVVVFRSTSVYDNALLDFLELTIAPSGATPTASPTSVPSTALPPRDGEFEIALKYVVFAPSSSTVELDYARLLFDSVGMAYTFVQLSSSSSLEPHLPLDRNAKYAGIVTVSNFLTTDQISQISDYQDLFGVKWLALGADPSSGNIPGVGPSGGAKNDKGTLRIGEGLKKYTKSLKNGFSVVKANNIPCSPAAIQSSEAKEGLSITYGSTSYVAAAVVNDNQLFSFCRQHEDYAHSVPLIAVFQNFLSVGGVHQGMRRIYLSPQIDDLFMASFLWDPKKHKNPLSMDRIYRCTPSDLENSIAYLERLNSRLPSGSNVTLEFGYNGLGVQDAGGYDVDPLFKKTKELNEKFFFESHTWSHPCDLDTASYEAVYQELSLNRAVVDKLFDNGFSNFHVSETAMINPCITGLQSAKSIRAMVDNKIVNAVGDNSVDKLTSDNPYHGLWSDEVVPGASGVFIVPREVSCIDYDASTIEEQVDEYNTVESGGKTYTFEQIFAEEAVRVSNTLLAFRHDPYMFHQSNIRYYDYNDPRTNTYYKASHVQLWIDYITSEVTKYSVLPIQTLKHELLARVWKNRRVMDTCGLQLSLKVNSARQAVGLSAVSSQDCQFSLSGAIIPSLPKEIYGPETTTFVTLKRGQGKYFLFENPVNL